MPRTPPTPTRLVLAGALLGAALAPACASKRPEPDRSSLRPFVDASVPPDDRPVGYFLADLDAKLRAWGNLKLGSGSEDDLRRLRTLERDLAERTRERLQELVLQLDSPSAKNRAISAAALGFSGETQVVAPLVDALTDPSERVVNNALLGLGVLASPDTPLARICAILTRDPDGWTRTNAAFALQGVVAAGGRSDGVAAAARSALADPEPAVRTQAATVAGLLGDVDAVRTLGDLLHDDVALVGQAAAAALGRIGAEVPAAKGDAARHLVDALPSARPSVRRRVLLELTRLSGEPHGNDVDRWTQWAYRLP